MLIRSNNDVKTVVPHTLVIFSLVTFPLASPKALHQVVIAEILDLGHALETLLEGLLRPLNHGPVILSGLGRGLCHHVEELVRVAHQDARAVGQVAWGRGRLGVREGKLLGGQTRAHKCSKGSTARIYTHTLR